MEEMWLARDNDGRLYLYLDFKPDKLGLTYWNSMQPIRSIEIDKNSYPEVKWSDAEPTKVKFVIEK